MTKTKKIGLFAGIILFALILLIPEIPGLSPVGQKVLASTVLMICWWGTEALPLGITGLVPLVLYPLLGIASTSNGGEASISLLKQYSSTTIVLLIATFMIGAALVKWNVHKRIALSIVKAVGVKPSSIVFGFLIAVAFVSMFMSNTTACAMMIPIALAILTSIGLKDGSPLGKAIFLALPWAASLGGIATPIGTTTNLSAVALIKEYCDISLGFIDWMKIGLPFTIIMIPLCWFFLVKALKLDKLKLDITSEAVDAELRKLGKMTREEICVMMTFVVCFILWVTRAFWADWTIGGLSLAWIGDDTIGVMAVFLLFMIPSTKPNQNLLDLKTAMGGVSWDTAFLVAGALTMGGAFAAAGCTDWLAGYLGFLNGMPEVVVVIIISVAVALLTEFATNVVVVTAFIPVLVTIAAAMGISPMILIMTASISASFAFMLPAGTPPNAIAFSSGQIEIKDMAMYGFGLKIIACAVFPLILYGITIGVFGLL